MIQNGTLRLDAETRKWRMDAPAHVLMKARRIFGKVGNSQGFLELSDTQENARDLEWFLSRYPMQVDPYDYLRTRSISRKIQEHKVKQIVNLRAPVPELHDLAVPLRDYQKVSVNLVLTNKSLLLADDLGVGKAQPLTAKVLTPTGWRRMGDLQPGDAIVDPDGGTGVVEEIFPQGALPAFRVTTKDGASAECCAEHLWGLYSANDRKRGGTMRVKPLQDFMHDLRGKPSKLGWTASKWFLPLPVPVEFSPLVGSPPLHPYVLGVLLGDGNTTGSTPRISNPDEELLKRLKKLLPATVDLHHVDGVDWRIVGVGSRFEVNPVMATLRQLGVAGKYSWEKSVPTEYLRASVTDRLELLRGLMDTDGGVEGNNNSMFSTSSKQLCDDVVELVRSLGGIASVSTRLAPKYTHNGETRTGRQAYRVLVRLPMNPFQLSRKAERWSPPNMARAIDSVEALNVMVPMQCIRVSTKRRLYITNEHIVTHNTAQAIGVLTEKGALPALVVTMTHLPKQWEREINRFMPSLRTHVVTKGSPYDLTMSHGRVRSRTPKPFPDVVIMNYHKLAGWAETLAPFIKFVVFDECQELRSGYGRDIPKKYTAAKYLSENADYRLGMSATPIFNYGGEFFAVIDALHPEALGTYDEFQREWCAASWGDKPKIRDPQAFGTYLLEAGMMLRRTRKDVGRELPQLQRIPHHVDCDPEELDKVEKAVSDFAKIILGSEKEAFKGQKRNAHEQFSLRLRQATGIAKAPHVAAFVKMVVESGEKVVVFGWHREFYSVLQEQLKEHCPLMYTGTESAAEKEKNKRAFIEGDCKVLLMSLRSGAGLDGLQHVARTCVFGELDWSPGVHEQCLSDDTEVLTREGFKSIDEAGVGTVVAAFDPVDGAIRWLPATSKTDRLLAPGEDMYGAVTKKFDARVTGEHRMVVRSKTRTVHGVGRRPWEITLAQDLAGQARRFIPLCGQEAARGVQLTDAELRLLGWYIADGSFDGRTLYFHQAAHQPWNEDLQRTLTDCGLDWQCYQRVGPSGTRMNMYCVHKGTNPHWSVDEVNLLKQLQAEGWSAASMTDLFSRTAGAIAKKLRKVNRRGAGHPPGMRRIGGWASLEPYLDKSLSPLLDQMTREQLQHLLHGLYMGDGSKSQRFKKTIRVTSTNKLLLDRLQSLCVRRGYSARISERKSLTSAGRRAYDIYVSTLTEAAVPRRDKPNGFSPQSRSSSERVWCLTNALGTLVVRRNGKVHVTGNCIGRLHRDGQQQPVVAYYLLADAGSDPIVADILGLKTQQLEGVINPDAEIVEEVEVDLGIIKRMAQAYLDGKRP